MPTVEVAPRGPRPPIRLRPVPRCEPPFDDELDGPVWASPHQLTFEWPVREAEEPAAARVPYGGIGRPPPTDPAVPRPAPPVVAGASGDAKLAVRRFVCMCVEVLNGYRPAAHLRRMSLPKEAAGVVAQGLAGAQRVGDMRRTGPHRRAARRPGPVAVLKLQLCEPRRGAVEAAVLLVTGERTWAMALRMELHQQSWCATTLRLI